MKSVWKYLALFFYRRWVDSEGHKPVGIPGNRDPELPCTSYEPRRVRLGDCMTDGHYLCRECCHRDGTDILGSPIRTYDDF